MKVRITPSSITVLGDPEVRISGEITDVELKLHSGRKLTLSMREGVSVEGTEIKRDSVLHTR